MQNLRALGAPPPDPVPPANPQPPAAGGFPPRPPKQPPIADFWLRASILLQSYVNFSLSLCKYDILTIRDVTGP